MAGKFDFDCPCVFSFNLKGSNDLFNLEKNIEWFQLHHADHDNNDRENALEVYPLQNIEGTHDSCTIVDDNCTSHPVTAKSAECTRSEIIRLKPTAKKVDPISTSKPVKASVVAAKSTVKSKATVAVVTSVKPLSNAKSQSERKATLTVSTSTTNTSTRNKPTISTSAAICDDDIMQLLKKHNKHTAPPAVYEPARYSVREVRKWEKMSGKLWADLNPKEREEANAAIEQMKRSFGQYFLDNVFGQHF